MTVMTVVTVLFHPFIFWQSIYLKYKKDLEVKIYRHYRHYRHVALQYWGIDTSDYSYGYLAG